MTDKNQIEINFFGPGYGESILIHIGNGKWVIVDSCINTNHQPAALSYLRELGLNPAEVVRLIVATHWHDDHVRGISKLVEICKQARFCCAGVLCQKEFLIRMGAVANKSAPKVGYGMREFHQIFSLLNERKCEPVNALSNRLIYQTKNCKIWSLSPSDRMFNTFLENVSDFTLPENETGRGRRIASINPNEAAVVLLVKIKKTLILLGSDLEKQGWLEILNNQVHPNGKASVFKIPHHGSSNAHENGVWNEMLLSEPVAVLTPWQRGAKQLPNQQDIDRILAYTPYAYATASARRPMRKHRNSAVARTIRESGATITPVSLSRGMIRLCRQIDSQADWDVEKIPPACALKNF